MNTSHVKGRIIDAEGYRVEAMQAEDWQPEDIEWIRTVFDSDRGKRLVKMLALREQAELLSVARCRITTEEGRLEAIQAQGRGIGYGFAINSLFSLTEDNDVPTRLASAP